MKRLSAAGRNPPPEEALIKARADNAFTQLATKADMKELRADMREMELRLGNTLTVRFGAMLAASVALTVATLGILLSPS